MSQLSIQLPSRGYTGITHVNLSQPSVDHVRRFLAFEGKHTTAINALISSVCDESLDNLPVGDRDHLFVTLRRMVNPNPIEGSFQCSACGNNTSFRLDYTEVESRQLPDDLERSAPVPLPVSGDTVKMNVFTVRMENELDRRMELVRTSDDGDKTPHSDLGDDLGTLVRLALMIESDDDVNTRIEYLRKLDWTDFEKIMLFDTIFQCGPVIGKRVTCRNEDCGSLFNVKIPIDSNFLGLTLRNLLSKHRFLSKVSSIGYQDFLSYSVSEMDHVVDKEVDAQQKKNQRKGKL